MPRGVFSKVFARGSRLIDNRDAEMLRRGVPLPGAVGTFRTAPLYPSSSCPTGRVAALKVLVAEQGVIAFAVLDGVWSAEPTFLDVGRLPIAGQRSFAWTGQMAAFGVPVARWHPADLEGLVWLGRSQLSQAEARLGRKVAGFGRGLRFARLSMASDVAEAEWRWVHDREAVVGEYERNRREAAASRRDAERLRSVRLSSLSLQSLLANTPFAEWSEDRRLPRHFVDGARAIMREAYRRLDALGPDPSRAQVRTLVRGLVQWFNEADRLSGGVIDTREREEVREAIAEVVVVAGHRRLVEAIDALREW